MRIVVYLFSAIGFIGTLIILVVLVVLKTPSGGENKSASNDKCLNDGSVIRLDSYYDENESVMYELIAHTTGFSDKVTFISLLKGKYYASSSSCIKRGSVVFSESVYYGEEHGAVVQWPKLFRVSGEVVTIEYSTSKAEGSSLANVPVAWK